MDKIWFLVILYCSSYRDVDGYNIETAAIATRFFVHEPRDETDEFRDLNKNPFFGHSFQSGKIAPEKTEIISMMVSAPLEKISVFTTSEKPNDGSEAIPPVLKESSAVTYTESTGKIYNCVMPVAKFALKPEPDYGNVVNCTMEEPVSRVLNGFDIGMNDTLGISMAFDSRKRAPVTHNLPKDRMLACAHLRAHNCGTAYNVEGTCYLSGIVAGRGDGRKTTEWKRRTPCREECFRTKIDLMFVIDGSQSIGEDRFETVKDWVINVAAGFDISDPVQIGVVQYSHYFDTKPPDRQKWIKTEIALGTHHDHLSFARAVRNISYHAYTTFTAHAIQKTVRDDFKGSASRYPEARRVMILLTDGNSTDKEKLPGAVEDANRADVTSFAVGVKGYVLDELLLIAGSLDRVITVGDFDQLKGIVSRIQYGIQVLEGTTETNVTNGLMQCQAGISSEMSQNGRLYLGAVGAYDWSGTVTKYDSVSDSQPDIPDYAEVQKVLPERTKESYMGYSVTTGYFVDRTTEYVATGAPRYKLMGAVVVYRPVDSNNAFNDHVTIMGNKKQLGSYFGGSVMSADVNGDNLDDLFIGAPLYVHDSFDEGRVFVFISQAGASLTAWERKGYQPLELEGDNLPGGRFGTAMADAGDLNNDGYKDVIVGAPLTDSDRGAVFVYHGSRTGMDTKFKQKILASEMTGVTLKYFGQSLQGGVDLDGNQYPDIAVGAPKSDTVVIFRSRPVVVIDPVIRYTDNTLDIFECIEKNYESCATLQVCFEASGVSVEDHIGITFNVTIDTNKVGADKRLEFKEGQENAKPTWSQETYLTKDSQSCFTRDLHMKRSVKDYDSVITAEVQYDLLANHTAQPLSSVRDPSISNKKTTSMSFVKNCGDDGKCVYDLRIDARLEVPEYIDAQGEDVSDNGKVLVIDQTMADTTVKVNLSNHQENAFDTKIKFAYTSLISLSAFRNKIGYPASNSCIVEESDPVDRGNGTREQILRYNYKTNIMRQDSWCYFEFSLRIENLKNSGTMDTLSLNVTAYTSDSSSSSEESNPDDNVRSLSRDILYRSDFDLKKKKETAQTSFNYTTEAARITSVYEIGNRTSDIEVEFEISGQGYSNIPRVDASLNYPLMTSGGDRLLYLYKVECTPKAGSQASCSCNESMVNEYNLTLEHPNENNTNENRSIEINPPAEPIESSAFNCYTKGDKNFTCDMLQCTIDNLYQSDQVVFKAYFRLWSSSITFNGSDLQEPEIRLHARFEVTSNKSLYIIDENGETGHSETQEVLWIAKKYRSAVAPEATQAIWIYIVAAIGGLLLLIILVIILWKVGFFKSKYADMKKDAEDELADETEFANGNGSQAEMAG